MVQDSAIEERRSRFVWNRADIKILKRKSKKSKNKIPDMFSNILDKELSGEK